MLPDPAPTAVPSDDVPDGDEDKVVSRSGKTVGTTKALDVCELVGDGLGMVIVVVPIGIWPGGINGAVDVVAIECVDDTCVDTCVDTMTVTIPEIDDVDVDVKELIVDDANVCSLDAREGEPEPGVLADVVGANENGLDPLDVSAEVLAASDDVAEAGEPPDDTAVVVVEVTTDVEVEVVSNDEEGLKAGSLVMDAVVVVVVFSIATCRARN